MEWTKALKESIEYIEKNMYTDLSADALANHVHISPFYFQKAFHIMTGYAMGEYIRNRRLYLAAIELIEGKEKVIDVAYRYGYETPESFSKAFTRFHGLSPMKLKKQPYKIKTFHPIEISVFVKGGTKLEYTLETIKAFKVMGIKQRFTYENAFDEVPKYWGKWQKQYQKQCLETTVNMGKYGISVDAGKNGQMFEYYIAGDFDAAHVNNEWEILEIPALEWVKFSCIGPMPTSLQSLNTRIFNEWLPGNKVYEISAGYNIEVYKPGDINDINYTCEIWLPVKKIEK